MKKKKKGLMIAFMVFLTVAMMWGYADAKVSGACSNCHTMHNSQDGSADTYDSSATPNQKLLKGSCTGCHAQNTSSNTVNSIPQVLHTSATELAAGNFRYVATGSADGKGHNVEGIVAEDGTLSSSPPGYNSSYDPSTSGFQTSSRLTCAGANGCHGNRDQTDQWDAVSGGHHGDDTILQYGSGFTLTGQGASVATSYRFLYKIKGAEDSDWHNTRSATDHNEYLGEVYATRGTTDSWANMKGTISELCAECHANYHISGSGGIGTASPWIRHPTDVLIPNSGEYASISTTYDDETPVGRSTIADGATAASGTVAAGSDRVICLSCHRAHGSDQNDNLRFSYSTSLSAGAGCLHCHTNKDAY